jgi:hypothetical protein
MSETALDTAHAAMEAAPGDDRLRLAFLERLIDAELYILLERPAEKSLEPQLLELEEGPVVLVFDRETRLAEVAPDGASMAELSGRALVEMLKGAGLGLGLNLGAAPSAFLLPPDGVAWLADLVAARPRLGSKPPAEVRPPEGLSDHLLGALEAKLPTMAGMAQAIGLATGSGAEGSRLLIAVFGAGLGTESAIATAIGEALNFSGADAGNVDMIFPVPGSEAEARLQRVALCREIPRPEPAAEPGPPGLNPSQPPKL